MLLMVLTAMAQMEDPVKFTAEIKTGKTAEAEIVFSGRIEAGWHIYSTDLGSSGPTEASFHVNKADGIELVGKLMPRGKEKSHFDAMFGMNVRYFEGTAQFVQKIRFTKPTYTIDAYLEYGVCSDENCLPPGEVALKKSGKSPAVAAAPPPPPLVAARDRAARGVRQRGQHSQPLAVVHLHRRIYRRTPRPRHALHLAHHPDDHQLLPQACQGRPPQGHQGRHDLRSVYRRHLSGSGPAHHRHLRPEQAQRAQHQRRIQRHPVPAAARLRLLLLRLV